MAVTTDPKKILLVVVGPVGILAGSVFVNLLTTEMAQQVGFAFYAIVFGIYAWKKLNIRKLENDLNKRKGNSTISKSMDIDEAMSILREWSEENFSSGNRAHFQWSSTHYETTIEHDPQSDDEPYMFYAFITYGEYNRLTLFCIEGKNGDIVSIKPVRNRRMLENPFDFVPLVQELRRKNFNFNGSGERVGPNQPAQWKKVYQSSGQKGGMPIDQQFDMNVADQQGQLPGPNPSPNQNTQPVEETKEKDNE